MKIRALLALPLLAVLLAGCGGDDPKALHEAGRSLVPHRFRVLREVESGCVEGRGFPSCVTVYFSSRGLSPAERIRLVAEQARAGDWNRLYRTRVGPRATSLSYERGGYSAFVRVWLRGPAWKRDCRRGSGLEWLTSCADSVQVLKP